MEQKYQEQRLILTAKMARERSSFIEKYLPELPPEQHSECIQDLYRVCKLWHARESMKSVAITIAEL